jgi:hypothetical protein
MGYLGAIVIERSQTNGVKPKMRGRKLRSGVYWRVGRGFDSRWCHLTEIEYLECFLGGKGGRCLGLTTLPPKKNLGALTSWIPRGLARHVMGLF